MHMQDSARPIDTLFTYKGVYPVETKQGTKLLIDEEYDERENISLITNAMIKISETKKSPFFIEKNTAVYPTSIASRQLLNLLPFRSESLKRKYPNHTFNPHVNLFNEMVEKWSLDNVRHYLSQRSQESTRAAINALNGAADEIKELTQGSHFKNLLANRRRRCQKNKKSILTYIKSIFNKPNNSTLLIIRIDCAYKSISEAHPEFTYESVREHRGQLVNFLQSTFKSDFLGYVAKLEYGLKKRYHYHWIIILNGNRLRRDVAMAP